MKRLKSFLCLCAVAALAACGTASVIQVNLGNTQAEATGIYDALAPFVGAIPSKSVSAAYAALGIAVKAYAALPTGTVPDNQIITDLTGDFSSVISQVTLPADTKVAIDAGLALIDGLAAGLASVPAPASASPSAGSAPAAGQVVAAPIPIPLS